MLFIVRGKFDNYSCSALDVKEFIRRNGGSIREYLTDNVDYVVCDRVPWST